MWQLRNDTPFAAERTFTRAADGTEVFVVAVRATFDVAADGSLVPAAEQPPVVLAPEFFGDPAHSGLRYESDLIDETSGTDLVVHGTAYAPRGRPVPSLEVGLSLGAWHRDLRVVGDRRWRRGIRDLVPSAPEPFERMPLTYDRAWGGTLDASRRDERNPIGTGAFAAPDTPVPNLEELDAPVTTSRTPIPPAGVAPIPSHWEPRRSAAGTHDDTWMRTRRPLRPVDFQLAANRCAPVRQQLPDFVRGNEVLVLRHLTPDPEWSVQLPPLDLLCTTAFDTGRERHRGRVHTIYVEPDVRRVALIWVSRLPCHHTLYRLRESTVSLRARLPLGISRARARHASAV
ncbi:MAG: DUF2169 domain-containing protein [Gemmatimonadaceae bacterium]|jgi:hypothetical protein|nr:DUF2169 domain-containing protein [Gemmatimonadaceae bacterium]